MGEVEMVQIPKKEYDELSRRDLWLACLEEAGVDSWDGYAMAQEILHRYKTETR